MDLVIDTSKTYTFANAAANSGFVLAVNDTDIFMVKADAAGANGQWFLTRVLGNQPGIFFRVHPASMGLDHSLDVVNVGGAVTSTNLTMSLSDNNSGQAWRFNMWSDNPADGLRLSNKMSGKDVHLDVDAATLEARLMGGDFPGQHWMMIPVGGVTASEADTAVAAEDGGMLTEAGIVGLSVSAALGFSLLIFGSIFWLVRYRRRRIRSRRAIVDFKADALQTRETLQGYPTATLPVMYKV